MDYPEHPKIIKNPDPKQMHFLGKMEPFWEPMGTQKSQKCVKVLPKIALFTPSEKCVENQ